jgi:putative serine protease PepD
MTENFPGAGGGPAEDPRHSEQRAETGSAQPTGQDSGGTPWYGQPDSPQPPAQEPSPWAPSGLSHYGDQPAPPSYGDQPAAPSYGDQAAPPSYGDQPTPPPYGDQPTPPSYGGYPPIAGPPTGPLTGQMGPAPYRVGVVEPRRRGPGGLVAGVAVLALVVGGLAGGLGGYLVSNGSGSNAVISSLQQPAPAKQTANAPAGSVQAAANKVLPVVVTIAAEFQSATGATGDTGSGIIISSNGNILTNNHVISGAATGGKIQAIFADGRTVDATIVGRDPTTDIAVIKAQGVTGLPTAALGRSDNVSVGEQVVAIGAPFDLAGTVTSGIVSSLHRPTAAGDSGSNQTTVLDAIQTDAPINPGNSGGPLVNMQGQVIGINSAIYSPNSGSGLQGAQGGNVGIGFAIPIDQAKRIANEIVQTGKAIQTVLGVQVKDNVPSSGGILPNGALISAVTAGGPADKSGLKAGAVVVKADDRLVTSSDGLVAAVHAAAPGDQMKLTLNNGNVITVTLTGQPVPVN